jgi:hypothetical protein
MAEEKTETNEHGHDSCCRCPLCMFMDMTRERMRDCPSMRHFKQARVEVLKGVRAFLDERIEKMEKESRPSEPRVTKIDVE